MGEEPIVLVVDDDTSVREALGRLLGREGIVMIGAGSLAAARERITLHRSTLRVAIVDLGLGEDDGLDLVRELKQSALPLSILVFSAAADGAARVEALALGVEEVLIKPASPGAILSTVRRSLDGGNQGMAGEWLRTHPSPGSHRTS